MTKYTVLSYPHNHAIKKAFIAAEYGGIVDQIEYPNDFKMGVDNKTEEFKKISPLGKVPTLKIKGTEQGIFESNAIARYIARVGHDEKGLLGKDALEQSLVDAWIDFTSFYVINDASPIYAWKFGFGTYDTDAFNKAVNNQKNAWTHLEGHLKRHGTKFLVNDRVTLADIVLGVTTSVLLGIGLDKNFRNEFPTTEAYFRRLFEQEQVKKHLGEVKFVEKFEAPQ
jgi:glutathione S-transferase